MEERGKGERDLSLYSRIHSVNTQTTCQVPKWGEAKFCEEERV